MEENPYQPPSDSAADRPANESSKTRKIHLAHEGAVRLLGLVILLLGGSLILFGSYALIFSPASNSIPSGLFTLLVAAILIGLGLGLFKLETAARRPAIFFSILALFAFPVGTFIGGYCLWLLSSRRGQIVFSPQYYRIISGTPHLKARASLFVRLALGILITFWILSELDKFTP